MPTSPTITAAQQVVHQRRRQVRILGQALEAWLQQRTIIPFQLGQSRVAQPVGHAAQGIEQVAQLPGQAIAAGAQPQVAERPWHALGLQQGLAQAWPE